MNFAANIERFTGFAAHYDEHRPSPPDALSGLLCQLARSARPELVVDLGSGTGLSTRYWSGRAEGVIGIEPTPAMREEAERVGGDGVSYREGFSHATGLPDACADIVTCSQALHWMEPTGTFREVARILRDGGVFAAYDYDWPPVTASPEADALYAECMATSRRIEKELGVSEGVRHWPKDGHLARLRESGVFSYVRECTLHHVDTGNAARLIGLLLSQGHVQTLLKHGVSEEEIGIPSLREVARRNPDDESHDWYWSLRVRIGIK